MKHLRTIFLFASAILVSLVAFGRTSAQAELRVTPLKLSGVYKVGERVGWTVEGTGKVRFVVKKNNYVELKKGELNLASGKTTVECTLDEPGMVFMTLSGQGQKNRDFGAAVEPTAIKPAAPRPADFDAFWARKVRELKAVPENTALNKRESGAEGVDYATIRMDHVNGTYVHGQIAKPTRPGRFPAVLILQWASPPYPLHPSWVTERAKEGWLALNIQPHNVLPTEPESYYRSVPEALKNYTAIHQTDREKNYFVEMYLRGYRALDYLAQRPDWDGKTLLVMGTSMGGQQSLAVAGLHPKVTHLIVNVPAGCDLNASLHGRQLGYPNYPDGDPKAMDVARYIDCANFAPNIKAASLVAMGFVDTVCPPAGIWAAFNLIRGPKEVVPLVDSPHNHLATPEQQAPISLRTAMWLDALARGEAVKPKLFAAGGN